MSTLSLISRKGGVAKSASTAHLAAALALHLAKKAPPVLVVDLDSQSHAGKWFGITKGSGPSIGDVLFDDLPIREAIRLGNMARVHVLAGTEEMGEFDIDVADIEGRERIIQRMLEPVRDEYSYILLDCPPGLGLVHVNAYLASEWAVVPVVPEADSVEGLQDFEDNLRRAHEGLGAAIQLLGLIITMAEPFTAEHRDNIAEIREHYGERVLGLIHKATRMREASRHRKTIYQYDPGSRAADEYRTIAREITRRTKKSQ